MAQEFEAKFLDIDKTDMRKRLKDIGATLDHPKKRYVRIVFHRCTDEIKGYARIRNEGDKITMTVKLYKDPKFPEEYEIEIKDSFENGANFLRALGLKQKAFQETYREKWIHPLAHEITFDDVPGIPTYMEIDCTGEESLNKLVNMLNLDKSKMRFGAFDVQYLEYYGVPKDVINNETPSLTFKNIKNEIKPTKNQEMLEKISSTYTNDSSFIKLTKSETSVLNRIIKESAIVPRRRSKRSHKGSKRARNLSRKRSRKGSKRIK